MLFDNGEKLSNIYWIDLNRFDRKIDKSTWLEIGETLTKEKFVVTLLCGFKKKKYVPEGYRLKIKYFKSIDVPGLFRYSLMANMFLRLFGKLRQEDIVIVSPGALWIGFFLKLAKRCNVHLDMRTVPVEIHSIRDRIDDFLFWILPFKLFKHLPDSFSFITELLKQRVEQEFNFHFQDYVIWHSGVNTQHFSVFQKSLEWKIDKFVITYLGVITRSRGLELVIEALSKLNSFYNGQVVFQVIGGGSYLADLKRIASGLALTELIDFKGYVPYESVPKYLQDTDCFICPLPDRPEWNVSSPIKVFEYLACGKPVILTPIPAHKNIVNNKDFIVWTEGNRVEDFVRAIEYAYDNRDILTEAAKEAPNFVRENYEWEVQGKKLADYLKRKYCASN